MRSLPLRPLSPADYAPYGDVLAAHTRPGRVINQGFARRFDHLVAVRSARPDAPLNVCVFRCVPRSLDDLVVTLLERHAASTQVFSPLGPARYLAVVALGGDRPDLATLAAFEVTGPVGVSYHPGVWHHPLIALDREADFTCLVHEDGSAGDCDVVMLAPDEQARIVAGLERAGRVEPSRPPPSPGTPRGAARSSRARATGGP